MEAPGVARKRSSTLTDAELRLMNVLWERGKATVGEVAESLPRGLPLAYSTVLTTMRILEHKGYVRHSKDGRAFVYEPLVDRGRPAAARFGMCSVGFSGTLRSCSC